ncbi:MAG: hypothetical protein ACNS61_05485, partial [Candidatus Wenzhouxiangella sp. M2_3B_020]
VENESDRAFIYSVCLSLFVRQKAKQKKEIKNLALSSIEKIPSVVEKLARCEFLIKETKTYCKQELRVKLPEWISGDGAENLAKGTKNTKAVVDALYRVDPEWAASVASSIEGASRGSRFLEMFGDRERLEKAKKSIVKGESLSEKDSAFDALVEIYWEGLEHASRGESTLVGNRNVGEDLLFVEGMSLSDVFPVIAGAIVFLLRSTPEDVLAARSLDILEAINDSFHMLLFVAGLTTPEMPWANLRESDEESRERFFASDDSEGPIKFVVEWVRQQEPSSLIICDPWLDVRVVSILRAAQLAHSNVDIKLISGPSFLERYVESEQSVDSVAVEWRRRFQSEPLPDILVVCPYFRNSDSCAIHDRWIIADSEALKLGSSLSGLSSRETSISVVSGVELEQAREVLSQYLTMNVSEKNGKKILYKVIPLS